MLTLIQLASTRTEASADAIRYLSLATALGMRGCTRVRNNYHVNVYKIKD